MRRSGWVNVKVILNVMSMHPYEVIPLHVRVQVPSPTLGRGLGSSGRDLMGRLTSPLPFTALDLALHAIRLARSALDMSGGSQGTAALVRGLCKL